MASTYTRGDEQRPSNADALQVGAGAPTHNTHPPHAGAPEHTSAQNRTGASTRTASGSLTPVEVATCGILSGLSVVLGVLSTILPFFNLFFQVLSAIPVAMIAARLRPRVAVTSVIVTVVVALVGGVSSALSMFQAAIIGALVGWIYRKKAGWGVATLAGTVLGAALGGSITFIIWLLTDLRDLYLESMRVSMTGYLKLFGRWDVLKPATDTLTRWINVFIDHWWMWVPISVLLTVLSSVLLGKWILGAVLSRIQFGTQWDPLDAARRIEAGQHVSPLPLSLHNVGYRYPTAERDALKDITLTITPGEFVMVEGPNGSGKSTLALVLAGAAVHEGTITRPGVAGLGAPGGTALLAQRSELQMLGDTVTEDVLWGLTPEEQANVNVGELLDLVGLSGMETAQTRHLSGGQLQRLSLAGALVRHPSLLISDESTAMIDQQGRADLIHVLASLPQHGTTVVHITHDASEAAAATRVIRLVDGHLTYDGPAQPDASGTEDHLTPATTEAHAHAAPTQASSIPIPWLATDVPEWASVSEPAQHLWADRVSHTFNLGTPWENTVLHNISMIVSPGDAVLISGGNGSGKTTLSRILTGLMAPTGGRCTLGGKTMTQCVGQVALSMQFARLQLQRPTVSSDILAAAHAPADVSKSDAEKVVRAAMDMVGLPEELTHRNIDQLSGGQMRRVALAGLFASNPSAIVLDEPFAGLDIASRALVTDVLARRRTQGLAVIVISHDTDGLDALVQRSLTLDQGVLA